ncbi:MAG: TatD family hydrolase [Candidatus Roizmanbacteria bacterium]|nr:TatD family hydrolase [Candidatus Roizmanbacteria bacterium]
MSSNRIPDTLVDTHCHLNFEALYDDADAVIQRARKKGVGIIVVPGSDVATSKKAIELTTRYEDIYAAVGIHPHHIYEYHGSDKPLDEQLEHDLALIEELLSNARVVAVGEVGIDRYYYRDTKYAKYMVDETFVELQKKALGKQMGFALTYGKSLILHNRLAVDDIISVLTDQWDEKLSSKTVFHCCEADETLLAFATAKQIYLGVDGDSTWSKKKQRFIKQVPLERLVLETDSPYLTPEPARETQKFPNEPAHLVYVRDMVAQIKGLRPEEVAKQTSENARTLFTI